MDRSPVAPVPESSALYECCAKYQTMPDGSRRLLSVSVLDRPIFNPHHMERIGADVIERAPRAKDAATEEDRARATRRAKLHALELIVCNPSLDCFVTLTFDPRLADRGSWDDVYKKLSVWLSNRVSRRGLCYVAVPEHHKDGVNIHFHLLCNSSALRLKKTNIVKKGRRVYNVSDWGFGFSTALMIEGENAHEKCAKYIFKYMTKQKGQKIGGRYYLHGGELMEPLKEYAHTPDELADVRLARNVQIFRGDWGTFTEYQFI